MKNSGAINLMSVDTGSVDKFLDAISSLDHAPWSGVSHDRLHVTKITGGLTNILYKVSLIQPESHIARPEILVRIFGAMDGLLDRKKENLILSKLSECGVSPRLIAEFDWGRLEEFLSNRSPLKSGVDMVRITPECDMVAHIAERLRALHSVDLWEDHSTLSANVLDVTDRWLSLAQNYGNTIKASPKCPDFAPPTIPFLAEEVSHVRQFITRQILTHPKVSTSSICNRLVNQVLCHNDMLAGNLLYDETDNSLRLIDFEYSGYNFAVADIANVCAAVCESIMLSGQPQDVGKNFPSDDVQLHFVSKYLGGPDPIPTEEHEPILLIIRAFAMAEELRWTIWGILQSQQAVGDFDYCMYYNSRFNAYKEYKRIVEQKLAALG